MSRGSRPSTKDSVKGGKDLDGSKMLLSVNWRFLKVRRVDESIVSCDVFGAPLYATDFASEERQTPS